MNFLGEDGTFFAQGDDKLQFIPKDANRHLNTEYIPVAIRNCVFAGGMVVCGGTVINLNDGARTRISDEEPKSPVSAWRLPGLKCAIFCLPEGRVQKEGVCALHIDPRNEQERLIWLDAPEGTRWMARSRKELLCISAFGRLLGRLDIPESFIE